MDKLGISFEFERVGKYKSAVEPYSRTSLSEPAREAHEALLDDIYHELTTKIAEGRGITVEQVQELIDNGPYISVDAQTAGLIDEIAYEDELERIVDECIARHVRHVNLKSLVDRKYYRYSWGPAPQVALVYATGTILSGADRDDLLFGEVMGAQTVAAAIRQARGDRDVKAIVLRINSPGGSGIASDLIWREVKETTGVKPLVVSMSDAAASGGYYIACAADSVFASPATITGSIGVYFGKVSLAGLYDKIGINKEITTRGAHADMYGLNRSFTDDEREILRHQVDMFYDNFVKNVAEGRHRTAEEIDDIAQGRVWTGTAAKQIGLIDDYGGLPRAITAAAQMAGIDDEDYQVTLLPRPRWHYPTRLKLLLGISAYGGGELLPELADLTDEHLWYLLPWRVTIR